MSPQAQAIIRNQCAVKNLRRQLRRQEAAEAAAYFSWRRTGGEHYRGELTGGADD